MQCMQFRSAIVTTRALPQARLLTFPHSRRKDLAAALHLSDHFRPYRRHTTRAAASSDPVGNAAFSDAAMSDWPCKQSALDSARQFVRDAASRGGKVVLAPDRDADGLCAGKPAFSFSMFGCIDFSYLGSCYFFCLVLFYMHACKPTASMCIT